MKIKTKLLRDALKLLSGIVANKTILPVLSCARLESSGGTLSIAVTNQDQYQIERIESDGDLAPICVNLRHLEFSLVGEECELKMDGGSMVIKSGQSMRRLATMDAGQFPAKPDVKGVKIGVDCKLVGESISKVAFCCIDPNSGRYLLECVHVKGTPKSFQAEACDGMQGAIVFEPQICVDFNALVPRQFVGALAAALMREGATLSLNENSATVTHDSGFYWCKQAEGNYPNTDAVYGGDKNKLGEIEVKPLARAMETCVALSDMHKTPVAKLVFGDGITVECVGNNSANDSIDGTFQAHEAMVNCNSFLQCLTGLSSERCLIYRGSGKLVLQSGNLEVHIMNMRGA